MIFQAFPKTPRLFRDVIISEKIDGTNSQVAIIDSEGSISFPRESVGGMREINGKLHYMMIGSRNRWITPESDNHGFARWAHENADQLWQLGPGRHFGEWWGSGIQRGYGLAKGEKRFSLFNTIRWCRHDQEPQLIPTGDPRIEKWQDKLPECVGLVPVLYQGPFSTIEVTRCANALRSHGSWAAPCYLNPEGIIVFHTAANQGFKVTLDNDESPKGLAHPTA